MRDDLKNTKPTVEPAKEQQTLKFYFTPAEPAQPEDAEANPHAKVTTHLPETVDALRERFGDAVLDVSLYANEHTVVVEKAQIAEVMRFLREAHGFSYFVDCGGTDRFTEEDRYEVFYNVVNIRDRRRLRVKVRVDEEDLVVPSVAGVFRAANWNERECYDMFGIRFEGHPDMRRMYMPEDFEYYPLRKEFPLLGIPGSLPLPPQTPEGDLVHDPFPAAHGAKPVKSYEEQRYERPGKPGDEH